MTPKKSCKTCKIFPRKPIITGCKQLFFKVKTSISELGCSANKSIISVQQCNIQIIRSFLKNRLFFIVFFHYHLSSLYPLPPPATPSPMPCNHHTLSVSMIDNDVLKIYFIDCFRRQNTESVSRKIQVDVDFI